MIARPLALSAAALIVASCAAGAAASPSALPSLRTTPAATPTTVPSVAATATPLLAPTGRILFSAIAPTSAIASIYVMNADSSGVTKLTGTGGGNEPAWSPDGKRIAFVRDDGIWVMDADGSQAKQIHHDPAGDEWPVWSPDGRQVAFLASPVCGPCDPGITWALSIINADGSGLRKIPDMSSPDRPAWSPDRQTLVFEGRMDDPQTAANGLQSIRLDGSGQRQLTTGPDSSPAFSPDGRLAFLRGASGG